MRKLVKFILLILLFSLSTTEYLQSQTTQNRKLAVRNPMVDEKSEAVSAIELSIVRSRFRDAVSNMPNIELIDRTDVNNILEELKFQQGALVSDDEKKLLGMIKGVDIIVSLNVTKGGGYLNIEASFLDVETANVVGSTQSVLAKSDNLEALAAKCVELAEKLTGISSSSSSPYGVSSGNFSDKDFFIDGISFKMVFVKGGSMYLGCTAGSGNCEKDENPPHMVTLTDFFMAETETTQSLWKAVMGYNNNPSQWKGEQLPVENVSWSDCKQFLSRLNELAASQLPQGFRFSLPSEAQWEYAARGGQYSSGSMYSGGNSLTTLAWFALNSYGRTHNVKGKAPNELGIYDMSGNVSEWCRDTYSPTFYSDNSNWRNPLNTSAIEGRVMRGGSWGEEATNCRVSFRSEFGWSDRDIDCGFRLALIRVK